MRNRAFTLPELITIIAIIILLIMISMPSLNQAYHVAYDRMCKNHLYHMGQTMHMNNSDVASIPTFTSWTGAVVQYGSRDLLKCKEDNEKSYFRTDDFKNYWILQNQIGSEWRATDVSAALGYGVGVGGGIEDPQLFTDIQIPNPRRGPFPHTHQCWCKIPESRASNQKMISITDEAELLFTFEETQVTIESWHGCGVKNCNSDHWLMKGPVRFPPPNGQPDPTLVVFKLGGKNFQSEPNPRYKVIITTEKTSYGMTDLITGKMVSPKQIMLMDANMPAIVVGEPGWMEHVKDRHSNRINYVDVGGAVHSITKVQLQDECALWENEGSSSQSLLGKNANCSTK